MGHRFYIHIGGLLLLLCAIALFAGTGSAKEHRVDCEPAATCDGLLAATLAGADVKDGDTVFLDDQVFIETEITVSKSVTIRGWDNGTTMVSTNSVVLGADGIVLKDLKLFPGMKAVDVSGVHNWTADNVFFDFCPSGGCLVIKDSDNWTVRGATFQPYDNDGLVIERAHNFTIEDCDFNTGSAAVTIRRSGDFSIDGPTLIDVVTGIYLEDSENGSVEHGVLLFKEYGIVSTGSANVTLTDLGIFGPTSDTAVKGFGIVLDRSGDAKVWNTTMVLCDYGLAVNSSDGATIRKNTFRENNIGLAVNGSMGLLIRENAFMDPIPVEGALFVKYSTSGATPLDAKGNFWGGKRGGDLDVLLEGNVDTSESKTGDPTPDEPPEALKPFPTGFTVLEDSDNELIALSDYFKDDTWYWEMTPYRQYIYHIDDGDNPDIAFYVGDVTCSGECIGNPFALYVETFDNWHGEQRVTLTLVDWRGGTISTPEFTLTVEPVNDRPVVQIVSEVPGTRVVHGHNGDKFTFNYTIWDDGPAVKIEARFGNGDWETIGEYVACEGGGDEDYLLDLCIRGSYVVTFDDDVNGTMNLTLRVTEAYGTVPEIVDKSMFASFNNLSLDSREEIYDLLRALLGIVLLGAIMLMGSSRGSITHEEEEGTFEDDDDDEEE